MTKQCLYNPGRPGSKISLSSNASIRVTNIQKATSSLQWYSIEPTIKFIPYTYPKYKELNEIKSLPKVGSYLENANNTLFKAYYPLSA
jgi:hypothetical protein